MGSLHHRDMKALVRRVDTVVYKDILQCLIGGERFVADQLSLSVNFGG